MAVLFIPAMGTDLGHENHPIALAAERRAQAFLADALVVFPGIVEEIDSGVDRHTDDPIHFILAVGRPQVVSADAKDRGLDDRAAQGTAWQRGGWRR